MPELTNREKASKRLPVRTILVVVSLFAPLWALRNGFSLWSLIDGVGALTVSGAAYVVTQQRRPLRSYLWLLLGSLLLFGLLVGAVAEWGGDVWLGFITWAGITAIASFWAIAYERIERRT